MKHPSLKVGNVKGGPQNFLLKINVIFDKRLKDSMFSQESYFI